jgi:molecular chaperone HscB
MVDPFDTLGIAPNFDLDLKAAEKQYRELARVLHPDRHVAGSPTDRRLSLGKAVEVNEAWRTVRDPIRRAEALLRRHGAHLEEGKEPKAAPEFLMEMMEQREALAEARASGERAAVERLGNAIRAREKDVTARVAAAFAALPGGGTALPGDAVAGNGTAGGARGALDNVAAFIGELRYYRRFLDEVSAIEDGFNDAASAGAGD